MLVVANALPIMIAIGIGILYSRGTIEFVPGAEKVVPSLVALGATLVILLVITWVIAPALFPLVKRTREFADRNLDLVARGSMFEAPVRLALAVVGLAAYGVLWANVVLLGLLALVDVAAIIASLVVFAREVLRAKG